MTDWNEIVSAHRIEVWGTAHRILGNRDDSLECCQDALLTHFSTRKSTQLTIGVRFSLVSLHEERLTDSDNAYAAERFIHRFLQHVLPRGFQKVRRYGFAHPRRKTDWDWLAMLVTVTLNMVYTLTVAPKPQPKSPNAFPCPKCGHPMSCLGFIAAHLPLPRSIPSTQQHPFTDSS